MPVLPEPTGGDFKPIPGGTYPARCYRFLDLGSHASTWQGQSTGMKPLVLLGWEIDDAELRMEDGRPMVIGKRYTWSMSERATLRKDLESWRGARFVQSDFGPGGFEVKNLINQPAIIGVAQVEKEGKVYANVISISRPMKGQQIAPLVNKPQFLWLSKQEWDGNVYDSLHDSLKARIAESPEYQALTGQKPGGYAAQKGSGEPPHATDPSLARQFAERQRTTWEQNQARRGSTPSDDLDDEIPF